MRLHSAAALAALVLLPCAAPALAGPASASGDDHIAYLAGTCGLCHGPAANAEIPALAGRSADEVATLLGDYREQRRPSPIMHAVTSGLDDATLAALAAYVVAHP